MGPWLETIGVMLLAAVGAFLGHVFSRLRRPYWVLGYLLPLVLVFMVGLSRYVHALPFIAPFSWITAGRTEFVVLSVACTMLLTTPLSRLPHKRQRLMVVIFMIFFAVYLAILPFLVPAFNRGQLSRVRTVINVDGVCIQTTDYTCGPASAVTALRKLGFEAEEGALAIATHTTSLGGTPPDTLAVALRKNYGPQGLVCEYRRFRSIAELRKAGITLAVVKFAFLVDHYVAVLDVTDDQVLIGDPIGGKRSLPYEEFEKIWRFSAITLRRVNQRKDRP